MPAISILRSGVHAPVPPGTYTGLLVTLATGSTVPTCTKFGTRIGTPHTLGSLAAGLATLLCVPGTVLDLVLDLPEPYDPLQYVTATR